MDKGSVFTYKTQFGDTYQCKIVGGKYRNGGLALQLVDAETGEPISIATLCVSNLPDNSFIAVKDYSENRGMLDFLVENGIVDYVLYRIDNGFVDIPVCKLTKEADEYLNKVG